MARSRVLAVMAKLLQTSVCRLLSALSFQLLQVKASECGSCDKSVFSFVRNRCAVFLKGRAVWRPAAPCPPQHLLGAASGPWPRGQVHSGVLLLF